MKLNQITIFSVIALTFLFGGSLKDSAQAQSVATSFGDHPLMDRFPDSEIISLEVEEDANYRLVLGTLQRTRGVVAPEASQRLRGDITKIIYEVSPEFSGEDVLNFFKEQLQTRGYTELFTCAGRACGSSNYWANDIFSNRVLYGPERNQYFVALRAGEDAELSPHISLYIITRGNRRLYAYLEIVEESLTPVEAVLVPTGLSLSIDTLNEQGSIQLPSIRFVNDNQLEESADIQAIVNLLENEPDLRIYLVAHLGGDDSLDVLMRRSQVRANLLRQRLLALGIDGERIIAQGVGPLAPACVTALDCRDRVELVSQ